MKYVIITIYNKITINNIIKEGKRINRAELLRDFCMISGHGKNTNLG
jgi:hypothetical protein